jgi:catechol 2,3-dioxygenase-like lactoylglutathione lyase family enzyme
MTARWCPARRLHQAGISGYKTGNLGLGHVVYWVKDLAASVKFYQDIMGFSISDYIAWDDNDAVFMHCNSRHHTLALTEGRPQFAGGRTHAPDGRGHELTTTSAMAMTSCATWASR